MDKNVHSVVVWSLIGGFSMFVLLMMFSQIGQTFRLEKTLFSASPKTLNFLTGEATVVIDYGNGKVRKFKGPVAEEARIWDLLQQAAAAGKINLEITEHFVPLEIGELRNGEAGKQWNLYVNNQKRKFAPFEIMAKPGDEVVFKFE